MILIIDYWYTFVILKYFSQRRFLLEGHVYPSKSVNEQLFWRLPVVSIQKIYKNPNWVKSENWMGNYDVYIGFRTCTTILHH